MLKFLIYLVIFLGQNQALDVQDYTEFVDDLNNNVKFIDEYTKWSSKLFAQPNYLYGDVHPKSPCPSDYEVDEDGTPESVHQLRPQDINCIAALGDSFTTGLNAHATTPADLLLEHRGISWSIGGDYTYSQMPTLANALKKFNPQLKGFSSRQHEMSLNRQEYSDHRLNIAKSGFHINSLPYQAKALIRRLKNESFCNWDSDWKLLTIFIGINDLCTFCKNDLKDNTYTPEQYQNYVRDALDILFNASVPRMFVNLVPTPKIVGFDELSNENYICRTFLNELCPCASSISENYTRQYQQVLIDLIKSKRYDVRDDFTVVIQPFLLDTQYPIRNSNNTIDKSYLAPDCFHFSGKAHSQMARALWNNMLEPDCDKRTNLSSNEPVKCPTKKRPYIFTSKNSEGALEKPNNLNNNASQPKDTTAIATSTSVLNLTNRTATVIIRQSSTSTDDDNDNNSVTSSSTESVPFIDMNSDISTTMAITETKSSWKPWRFVLVISFFAMCVLLIVYRFRKRRDSCLPLPQTAHSNFNRLHEESDNSDVEVYTQPSEDVKYYDDKQMTPTHGTRIPFE